MADITKCTNESCIIRRGCYRWTATPDPLWQAYSRFEPTAYSELSGDQMNTYYGCKHYIPDHRNHPVTDGETFNNIEQPPKVNE